MSDAFELDDPTVAAGNPFSGKNSSLERSLRARKQPRDKKCRWVPTGAALTADLRLPDGTSVSIEGKAIGGTAEREGEKNFIRMLMDEGYEQYGIEPDILASAKGIGGGFPMGACLATEKAAAGMVIGTHGSTFGGNPLAMAVGNAVLDVVLEPGFLEHVQQMSLLLKQRLAELKDRHPAVIAEIRGQGLLLGLRTHVTNNDFVAAARDQKLITISAGDNVVRLVPPLIVDEAEIGEAARRIGAACEALEAEMRALARRGAAE